MTTKCMLRELMPVRMVDDTPLIALYGAVNVTLKFIFYEDFRFVGIVAFTTPCEAEGDAEWRYHDAVLRGGVVAEDDWNVSAGEPPSADHRWTHYR